MPVEERLRSALADQAATVGADVEGPLERVRRRRTRRVTAWSVGAAAASVVLVAAAVALLPQVTQRPEPAGPPTGEPTGASDPTIPFATYTRMVTDDEALDAGIARESVADLFGGAGRARVELVLHDKAWASEQEGWALWFVDTQGERRIGERGFYYPTGATSYEHDGDLVLVGQEGGFVEIGFNYVFSWELEAGSLTFEPVPKTTDRPTAVLLGDGTWERR